MYNIIQKPVNKHGSRGSYKPLIIANHISAATMGSMYNTFSNPKAKSASSTYGVSRTGEIVQYVPINRAPWTQGRIQKPTAPIIKAMGVNPNLYAVSIEFEGYVIADEETSAIKEYHGIKGNLTPEQYAAGRWLHKHIQHEVERLYGHRIALDAAHVIGHYQIDSIDKPVCPGPLFPWNQLYADLAKIDSMAFHEAQEYLDYIDSPNAQSVDIMGLQFRVKELSQRVKGIWGAEAERKLQVFDGILKEFGFTQEGVNVVDRIDGLYKTFVGNGDHSAEAKRKLHLIYQEARKRGLVA